ncbi:hypothetical protein NDU88_009952 [Pleurodeles waltl]|uniref:Uncharacterized protein n=1 Tax=Pleurodeles waltl TaxID=8319 RepID=A0AAV7RZV3_PLEWA|nr:hypothetical protein NDU88_009952 [Pleurodeles waltl]
MVGVIPNLGEDLILGMDYVNFTSLLERAGQEQVNNAWWKEVPFGVSEEENRKPRIKLSIKQKREQRRKYQHARDPINSDPKTPPAIICTITGDFRQCQHEDLTLKHAWHQALHPDEHVEEEPRNPEGEKSRRLENERRATGRQRRAALTERRSIPKRSKKMRRRQAVERTPQPHFWRSVAHSGAFH